MAESSATYAVLVIDIQEGYFEDGTLAGERARLVTQCNALINLAKQQVWGVYVVQTEHAADRSTWTLNMLEDDKGCFMYGDNQTRILRELDTAGAHMVTKTRDSAFVGTKLAQTLRAASVNTAIIAGVSTHTCVFQTAADAYAENFRVIIAADAVATNRSEFHEPALTLLESEYRQKIITVAQIAEGIL